MTFCFVSTHEQRLYEKTSLFVGLVFRSSHLSFCFDFEEKSAWENIVVGKQEALCLLFISVPCLSELFSLLCGFQ